ncbi:dimethylargininase [Plantibacter sp. YIM 135347]|uniref:dimethylargininase n=1 Tax=Plantibacter sp. YIM 135347 TaxID=3423919 RepID=UPI003D32B781
MTVTWGRKIIASIAAALAATAVAFVGSVVAFNMVYQVFLLLQQQAGGVALLVQVTDYYFQPAIFMLLILIVLGIVGAFRHWALALVAGLASGILGVLIGRIVKSAAAGQPITGDAIGSTWQNIAGIDLVFVVLAAGTAATIGLFSYRGVIGVTAAADAAERRIALVRMPATNLAEGLVTHQKRAEIDNELADKQWDAYVAVFDAHGWDTSEISWAEQLADSVFVEDTVVLFGDDAVITRPGAESRRPETVAVETTVRGLGLNVHRIEGDATLDGGDVLVVGTTVYVGRSGRTNAEGVRQLRAIVAPLGYQVVAIPVTRALHLKTTVSALPDGTVVGYRDLVEDPSVFGRFLAVPEPEGAAVVALSDEAVLVSAAAPLTAALLEDRGYTVERVDISEFEKLEGGMTCLSVRVR